MSRESFLRRGSSSRHSTASHKRAPKQEKELAKKTGGRAIPGSGSGYEKGDIKKAYGVYRIEAKTTKNKSFSVTKEMIRKIDEAGLASNEIPVIVVEFIDEQGRPTEEVAIMPTYALAFLSENGV